MKKPGVDKDVIVLLITSMITAASWVGFEVYRAYTNREIPTGLERHLVELDPTLDTSVLDELESRRP